MKLLTASKAKYVAISLAAVAIFIPEVAALPKAPWAQHRAKGHARKVLSSALGSRSYNETEPDCVVKSALDIQSPKENVWGTLTGPEAAGVVQWLFVQPDLNLTATEDAGNWDNSM